MIKPIIGLSIIDQKTDFSYPIWRPIPIYFVIKTVKTMYKRRIKRKDIIDMFKVFYKKLTHKYTEF